MPTSTMNTPDKEHKTTYRPPKDEAEAQRRREYLRNYRRQHPEKVRQWNRAYYVRQAALIAAATGEGDAE